MNRFFESLINLLFPPKCPFCGKVLDAVGICPACEKTLPWVTEEQVSFTEKDLTCAAPLWYEGAVREALLRFKFRGGSALAEPLGEVLARCAAEQFSGEFDTVTWVPVSRKRLKKRGYAQSGLQGEAARRANVLGVYDPADPELIRDRRILLIDDIHTTGATLAECARVLRDNGAVSVLCLTAARTPNREKKAKNSQIVSCNQGKAQV